MLGYALCLRDSKYLHTIDLRTLPPTTSILQTNSEKRGCINSNNRSSNMRIATFTTNVNLATKLPKWFTKIKAGHTLVSFTNDRSTSSIIVNMKKNSLKITSNAIGTLGGLSSTAINVIITHDVTFKNGRVESITINNDSIYELRISCTVHSTRTTIPTSTLTSWGMDPTPLPPSPEQSTHQEVCLYYIVFFISLVQFIMPISHT